MSAANTQKPLQALSPTTSQSQQQQASESFDATMADAPDSPVQYQSSQQSSQGGNKMNGGGPEKSGAPGSSWNTKKFNEEYDRTGANVLDKDWDQTKYGDVLMDS